MQLILWQSYVGGSKNLTQTTYNDVTDAVTVEQEA